MIQDAKCTLYKEELMKRKIVMLVLCMSLILPNAAACGDSAASRNEVSSQAQAGTESQTESTFQTNPTESVSENPTELDEADFNSEIYLDFTKCLDAIYDVQAGSAGASLRAENAVDELKRFASAHPDELNEKDLCDYTDLWFSMHSQNKESVVNDFTECLNTTLDVAYENDSALKSDENFTLIVESIKKLLK